ncbi:hypothetical protein CPSG_08181 [Coccidioides posadasii str. Silveira]|uniref:Uncharacterized protein n=1 Tax=Coccidioides posadasii (strain RMSCC 757 / Silveira) TaxID=443226 RepID=E9DDL9_COCPS|nr:hypothetical protein CPSG_08181 [Coccidioides posadasii str. Silveira]
MQYNAFTGRKTLFYIINYLSSYLYYAQCPMSKAPLGLFAVRHQQAWHEACCLQLAFIPVFTTSPPDPYEGGQYNKMEEEVIAILKSRGIPFKYEDIRTALEDPGTRDWVRKHLGDDTLLSREELTLYSKIEASAGLDAIVKGTSFPARDQFSTMRSRQQPSRSKRQPQRLRAKPRPLRLQCRELKSQIREAEQVEQQCSKSASRMSTGHTAERQQTDLEIEDLIHDFEEKLQAAQKTLSTDQNNLISTTSSLLREHDVVLRNMEKVAANSQSVEESSLLKKRVSDLCALLARYIAEEISCRLDRVFLETVESAKDSEDDDPHVLEKLESVDAEINSLYPEISILSDMAARQQFHSPILRVLEEWQERSQLGVEEQLQHVLETIIQLTESTDSITEKLKTRQAHQSALNSLASTYQDEVGLHKLQKAKPENKRLSKYSSRLSQAYASPRESMEMKPDSAENELTRSLETMLRRYGISFSSLRNAKSTEAVNDILNEKASHMLEMLENIYATAASPLIPNLGSADKAAQLLSSAMHCDSDFEPSLVDRDQQQRIANLEMQIGAVQKGIESLNTDILHQSDLARENFMERWG